MSDRSVSINKEEILYKGWLKKQGGAFKTWQRRYFVLVGDYIFYFAKEDDQRPLGYIPLRGNKVVKHPFNPDDPTKYMFEILPGNDDQGPLTNNHETFLLWATNGPEMDEWLQVIRRVMYGKRGGGIFGQSLSDTITHESTTSTKKIPLIVEQCISYIRKHGLKEEGIFRLPGRSSLVKEIQESYDIGEKPDFDEMKADVHTVASLFKLYLRSLPEPVIPYDHYIAFYKAIKTLNTDEEAGKERLIRELAQLPRPNYHLLQYLCQFLHELQKYEKYNRMSILNLSTVFGPNIYRSASEDPNTLMEATSLSQKFMHLVIEKHEEMFPPNDSIDFSLEVMPVPPPRTKSSKESKSQNNPSASLDLLKELDEKKSYSYEPLSTDSTDQLLMAMNKAEDLASLEKVVNATWNRRSYNGDPQDRNSSSLDDLRKTESVTSFSNPAYNSSPQKNSARNNSKDLISFGNSDKLGSSNTLPNDLGSKPSQVPPPMGIDLTEGTPEHKRLSNHEEPDLSIVLEELQAARAQLAAKTAEYSHNLKKWKLKCEGLELMLKNEEQARRAAEERNKQFLKQLNAFIAEYGPSE